MLEPYQEKYLRVNARNHQIQIKIRRAVNEEKEKRKQKKLLHFQLMKYSD